MGRAAEFGEGAVVGGAFLLLTILDFLVFFVSVYLVFINHLPCLAYARKERLKFRGFDLPNEITDAAQGIYSLSIEMINWISFSKLIQWGKF